MVYVLTACEQDQDGTGSVLILLASCQQTCMTYTVAVCSVKKTPDDVQRNSPKHVEFYSKNKFQKLVHLVGFIIRINVLVFCASSYMKLPNDVALVLKHVSVLKACVRSVILFCEYDGICNCL